MWWTTLYFIADRCTTHKVITCLSVFPFETEKYSTKVLKSVIKCLTTSNLIILNREVIGYLIYSEIMNLCIVYKKFFFFSFEFFFCTKKGLLSLAHSSPLVLAVMCVWAPLGMQMCLLQRSFDQDQWKTQKNRLT